MAEQKAQLQILREQVALLQAHEMEEQLRLLWDLLHPTGPATSGPAAEPAAPNWSSWTKRLMAETMQVMWRILIAGARRRLRGGSLSSGRFGTATIDTSDEDLLSNLPLAVLWIYARIYGTFLSTMLACGTWDVIQKETIS